MSIRYNLFYLPQFNVMPSLIDKPLSPDSVLEVAEFVLGAAKRNGATAAETSMSIGDGLTVTVRNRDIETVERHRDKTLRVTVYKDLQKGSASTTDFRPKALEETVEAATRIAQYAQADPYAGLAEPRYMASEICDLDLDHPWELSVEEGEELALICEAAALDDERIKQSDGASVSRYRGIAAYANSHGFAGAFPATRHGLNCVVVGEHGGAMQRGYWYTVARSGAALEQAASVGRRAAQRTVAKLGARKLGTSTVPVLFEAPVASGLIGHFISAIAGSNLYRKASFLVDAIDTVVFSPTITIGEQPHLPRGLGSSAFDQDGVATRARTLVENGVLKGYVLDAYAARRLDLSPTGNAGGVRNLNVSHAAKGFDDLVAEMDRGLVVTDLMGFGVNLLTGDYSRGASGFWVEHGVIQYPVEEITIAGNLRDLFKRIVAVGDDVDFRGNIRTGSILIESMMIAGM